MVKTRLSPGVNCQALWGPVAAAGSSFEYCYNLGVESGETQIYGESEVIRVCQSFLSDVKILCLIFCCCKNNPVPSVSGKSQGYQECVKQTLDFSDNVLGGKSKYKAEMPYNMTTSPPSPMTSRVKGNLFRSQNWHYNPSLYGLPTPYPPGQGLVRIPDVVILNDRTKSATTGNIKQIIEMKFPGDPYDNKQNEAYKKIHPNVETMNGKNHLCNCEEEEHKLKDETLKEIITSLLMSLLTRGRGKGMKIPVPSRGGGGIPVPGRVY